MLCRRLLKLQRGITSLLPDATWRGVCRNRPSCRGLSLGALAVPNVDTSVFIPIRNLPKNSDMVFYMFDPKSDGGLEHLYYPQQKYVSPSLFPARRPSRFHCIRRPRITAQMATLLEPRKVVASFLDQIFVMDQEGRKFKKTFIGFKISNDVVSSPPPALPRANTHLCALVRPGVPAPWAPAML